jgi:hypothetical protein
MPALFFAQYLRENDFYPRLMSAIEIYQQLTLGSDLEAARRDCHSPNNTRYPSCLSVSVCGILQGLRSDRRQREELATDHDCVNLAGVADVFERIHVK